MWGKWFSREFEGERIPTLTEVMDYCKGRIKMNIEIKNLGKDSPLPDKVVQLITDHQMKEQCVVTSTRLLSVQGEGIGSGYTNRIYYFCRIRRLLLG